MFYVGVVPKTTVRYDGDGDSNIVLHLYSGWEAVVSKKNIMKTPQSHQRSSSGDCCHQQRVSWPPQPYDEHTHVAKKWHTTRGIHRSEHP